MLKSFVSLYTDNAADLAEAPTDARVFCSEVGHECWYYHNGSEWARSAAGGLRANGSVLNVANVADGQYLKREGGSIVGDMPAAGGITLADVYPIGSIYTSVVETNPADVFNFGSWQAFGAGRVLVGVDVGQTEFDAVGKTGGAKTHTLTVSEMPIHTHSQDPHNHLQDSHSHAQSIRNTGTAGTAGTQGGSTANNATAGTTGAATATNQPATATNQNAGGGQGHNNLMPFTCVYFWRRIS